MNGIVGFLAVLALAGLVDLMTGNRLGLGTELRGSLQNLGSLTLATAGFYTIGVAMVEKHPDFFVSLAQYLPFDPSVLVSCVLSSDLGALPIARRIAASDAVGLFSGCMIASGLGMAVSCQFPLILGFVKEAQLRPVMLGLACGVIALPCGLLASGLLLGLSLPVVLVESLPVVFLCVVVFWAYLKQPEGLVKCLLLLGKVIRTLSVGLFAVMITGVFFPFVAVADIQLVQEILLISLRTVFIAGGGLIFARLCTRFGKKLMAWLGKKTGLNQFSLIGFLLNGVSSLPMLSLLDKMDEKGIKVNAAFSVCGAYLIGGQMAFVSGLVSPQILTYYMVNKLVAGVCAVALVLATNKKEKNPLPAASPAH